MNEIMIYFAYDTSIYLSRLSIVTSSPRHPQSTIPTNNPYRITGYSPSYNHTNMDNQPYKHPDRSLSIVHIRLKYKYNITIQVKVGIHSSVCLSDRAVCSVPTTTLKSANEQRPTKTAARDHDSIGLCMRERRDIHPLLLCMKYDTYLSSVPSKDSANN